MDSNQNKSETLRSPRILSVEWGRMEIEELGRGRDFKLWPGGGGEWDWRETGMHHKPGIRPVDVQELLDHGCETVVLSQGFEGALHTAPETLTFLAERGIGVDVAKTGDAAEIYNRLATEGKRVGGLFHSTC